MKKITNILAVFVFVVFTFSSCKKIVTNVPPITPSPTTGSFSNVWVNGNVHLTISSGASNSVISTSGISVNTILIGTTLMINGAGSATVSIAKSDTIFANGNSTITNSGAINVGHIAFICNGASVVTINNITATDSLLALVNGVGIYTFTGSTPKLKIGANGVGTFSGFNMTSTNCDVAVNGSGKSEIYVTGTLRAIINGNGKVYYKGNPTTVIPVMINGNGQLIKQ